MTEWVGPILVEHKVRTKAGKELVARLGFPRLSDKAPDEWACDFQLLGWKDGRIHVAHGTDGLQPLLIAADAIRRWLARVRSVVPGDLAYEFVFPRFVPISYGLKFHHHLWELLDAEIRKKERQLTRRFARRAKRK
jgi:hypothetical protein